LTTPSTDPPLDPTQVHPYYSTYVADLLDLAAELGANPEDTHRVDLQWRSGRSDLGHVVVDLHAGRRLVESHVGIRTYGPGNDGLLASDAVPVARAGEAAEAILAVATDRVDARLVERMVRRILAAHARFTAEGDEYGASVHDLSDGEPWDVAVSVGERTFEVTVRETTGQDP
jgi:hypothetical protein